MSAVKDVILEAVSRKCLGNTKRGLKELASDCLNQLGHGEVDNIAKGTFLCRDTVLRVLECEENYRPQAETLERCLRYVGAEIQMESVAIKPRFRNRPKDDTE